MNSVKTQKGIILKGKTQLSKGEKEDYTHEDSIKEGEKSH